MLDWIRPILHETGFTKSCLHKIELALEEAFINVIHHGHKNRSGEISLEVFAEKGKKISITLVDQGPPFNPLEHEKEILDPSKPLEEINEGGLGIFLIKQSMDELFYERKEEKNRFTFIKKIY